MILNILNVPQLKLGCFATIRLIHQALMSTDLQSIIHQHRSMELAAILAGKLIYGDIIKK